MDIEEILRRAKEGEHRSEQEHDIMVFTESERLAKEHGMGRTWCRKRRWPTHFLSPPWSFWSW